MAPYGTNHDALANYIANLPPEPVDVQTVEISLSSEPGSQAEVHHESFDSTTRLANHLELATCPNLVCRVINVSRLSGPLLQLLGQKYEMDYELWTSRFQSSDREWFAAPMSNYGVRRFSHFNLSYIDFRRATEQTPERFKENKRLGHTIRLVRLLDLSGPEARPRIHVVRRISCHLRENNGLWTVIFLTDPHTSLDDACYETDIPGQVQEPPHKWLLSYVGPDTSQEFISDLAGDGFGFVLKILREMKTTWKLFLGEMEAFLEKMIESQSDDELIESANWLHRKFLLNIDYLQRQLFYHSRYINYLISQPSNNKNFIYPTPVFEKELQQEGNALAVVDQRLKGLKARTTAIIETALSLVAIKQARYAARMTELQIQESQATFTQGESIRRLTIVNMIYLPATFIATVFGMQIAENSDSSPWHIWSFVIVSLAFTILTLGPAAYRFEKRRSGRAAGNEAEASWLSKACRTIFPYRAVRVGVVESLQQPPSGV